MNNKEKWIVAVLFLWLFAVVIAAAINIALLNDRVTKLEQVDVDIALLKDRVTKLEQVDVDVRSLDKRITSNAFAIDHAVNVAEACADRLGVKIRVKGYPK